MRPALPDRAATAPLLDDAALAPVLACLPRARLVGGCVRDMLARREVADIDLATPDTPDEILAALARAGLRAIPTGLSHGTITALSASRAFEITTLRRDEATDGRHALVAWTTDFTEDAARRDFTINAMSLDQHGVLHDPFGGAADLQAGRVRFVGDAVLRIDEDRLRILRFFRFFARYGVPPADAVATQAIRAASGTLRLLSAERVWSEIKGILAVPDPLPVLALMDEFGVLAEILPEIGEWRGGGLVALGALGAPAEPLLRLASLLPRHDRQATGLLADRLKLSGEERQRLDQLVQGPAPQPGDDDAELRRKLAATPASTLVGRSWLSHPESHALRRRLTEMPRPIFPLEGRHVLALGAAPGPAVGAALRTVRDWWLQGGCVAGLDACEAKLQAVLAA